MKKQRRSSAGPSLLRRATNQGVPRVRTWQLALVPVALAVLVSANSLLNDFASDDLQQVVNNTFIRDIRNLPLAFTTTVWSYVTEDIAMTMQPYFRPMFSVLFTISYAVFGTAAWGWHLTSVLIHASVALLLFFVLKEVTRRSLPSLIAACLFAVHPVHAESVAWISGVTDPLMAIFFLPAFLTYIIYRRSANKYLLPVSLGLYLLALLSKETALALPILVGYWELSRTQRRVSEISKMMLLFAVPTALYFVMRYYVMGGLVFAGGGARYPVTYAMLTAPLVATKYLMLLVLPVGYSYQHFTEFITAARSLLFIGPLAILTLLGLLVSAIRSRDLSFAVIWFLATLLPALAGLRHFDQEYLVQERYLYLPSIGFCLTLSLGIERLASRRLAGVPGKAIAGCICASLILIWGAVHVKQNRVWHDSVTLFQHCVATDPKLATARTALSSILFNLGKQKEAENEARRALQLDPTCANAYFNMSFFAHRNGKLDEAIAHLELATEAVPWNDVNRTALATVYLNLGLLYAQRKEPDRADQALVRSMVLWPRPTAWNYAAQFYFDQGRYEESRALYERAARAVPRRYAQIHLNLARVYERLGQSDLARAAYERYLEYAPINAKDRGEVARRLSQL